MSHFVSEVDISVISEEVGDEVSVSSGRCVVQGRGAVLYTALA